MFGLFFLLFSCSQEMSVKDGSLEEDTSDNLLGDSNVFLEPDANVSGDDIQVNDDMTGDDSADTGDTVEGPVTGVGYTGLLLQQDEGYLNVWHFGVNIPCDWSESFLSILYYNEAHVASPNVGAMVANYGASGSCVVDLEYTIDLSAIGNEFSAGQHLFYAQDQQVIINLSNF